MRHLFLKLAKSFEQVRIDLSHQKEHDIGKVFGSWRGEHLTVKERRLLGQEESKRDEKIQQKRVDK